MAQKKITDLPTTSQVADTAPLAIVDAGTTSQIEAQTLDTFGRQLLHVQHQEPSSTLAGDFDSGAWRTRPLNTVLDNNISGASLSNDQIELPAGTYYVEASAPARGVDEHMVRLQNISDGTLLLSGTSELARSRTAGNTEQSRSMLSGRFTLSGPTAIELQHQCQATKNGNGLGTPAGRIFQVSHETYADIRIWKLSD